MQIPDLVRTWTKYQDVGRKQHTHVNDLIKTILLLHSSHKCIFTGVGEEILSSAVMRMHFLKYCTIGH